ncbi:hypothetical protein OSTOST_13897, partial [Ostertagia ostertagi]
NDSPNLLLEGTLVDDVILEKIREITGRSVTKEEATDVFKELLTNVTDATGQLEQMKDVLLRLCANYLTSRRQNGFALNP